MIENANTAARKIIEKITDLERFVGELQWTEDGDMESLKALENITMLQGRLNHWRMIQVQASRPRRHCGGRMEREGREEGLRKLDESLIELAITM